MKDDVSNGLFWGLMVALIAALNLSISLVRFALNIFFNERLFMGSITYLVCSLLFAFVMIVYVVFELINEAGKIYNGLDDSEKKVINKAGTSFVKTVYYDWLKKHPKVETFVQDWKKNTGGN